MSHVAPAGGEEQVGVPVGVTPGDGLPARLTVAVIAIVCRGSRCVCHLCLIAVDVIGIERWSHARTWGSTGGRWCTATRRTRKGDPRWRRPAWFVPPIEGCRGGAVTVLNTNQIAQRDRSLSVVTLPIGSVIGLGGVGQRILLLYEYWVVAEYVVPAKLELIACDSSS